MKIAISGKGGVGKTTLAALLARSYSADGRRVLAIDADPDANLAAAIGVAEADLKNLTPIAQMREVAEERTGHKGGFGGFFKLNPTVDDLPDALSVGFENIKVLALGTVEHGGAGCVCPEHTLIRALMQHIVLRRDEMVIMDMEAGIEHLGRSTASAVNLMIVVLEPGRRSIETARQIERLARDIGLTRLGYVGSKVTTAEDEAFIRSAVPQDSYLGTLPFLSEIRDADMQGIAPFDAGGADLMERVREIQQNAERLSQLEPV